MQTMPTSERTPTSPRLSNDKATTESPLTRDVLASAAWRQQGCSPPSISRFCRRLRLSGISFHTLPEFESPLDNDAYTQKTDAGYDLGRNAGRTALA